MAQHTIPPRTYFIVFAALILLTGTTIGIDVLVPLGALQSWVALGIATIKAGLVILFFMHVYYSTRLTWVVALSSLLWLLILISYTLTDYLTRDWLRVPGH
jgi:cytochrome c oxidase subunit 4